MKKYVLNSLLILVLMTMAACLEKNAPGSAGSNTADSGFVASANAAPVTVDPSKARNIIVEKDKGDFSTFANILDFVAKNDFYGDWLSFKDISIEGRLDKSLCKDKVNKCYVVYEMSAFYPESKGLEILNPEFNSLFNAVDIQNYIMTGTLKVQVQSADPLLPVLVSFYVTSVL